MFDMYFWKPKQTINSSLSIREMSEKKKLANLKWVAFPQIRISYVWPEAQERQRHSRSSKIQPHTWDSSDGREIVPVCDRNE